MSSHHVDLAPTLLFALGADLRLIQSRSRRSRVIGRKGEERRRIVGMGGVPENHLDVLRAGGEFLQMLERWHAKALQ